MQIPSGQPIARCALSMPPSAENECLLTDTFLAVRQKGKQQQFRLEDVWRLSFETRKWWLPIVAGGLLIFLCLTALMKTYYDPMPLMAAVLAGILLMYYGYRGSYVLVIHQHKDHTDFFIKSISPQLQAFVNFTNQLLQPIPESRAYYIPVVADGPQQRYRCLRQAEWRQATQYKQAYVADPLLLTNRLEWLSEEGTELKPFIRELPATEELLWEEDRSGRLGPETL